MSHDGADGRPESPRRRWRLAPYRQRRSCPECAQGFVATNGRQEFCSPRCQADFQNRNSARGRASLVQLALAWRAGRNIRGQTPEAEEDRAVAKRAFDELCRLVDEYARQDRAAGRSALAYLKRRWKAEGTL